MTSCAIIKMVIEGSSSSVEVRAMYDSLPKHAEPRQLEQAFRSASPFRNVVTKYRAELGPQWAHA
jgi:hypothetical protein